MTSFSRRQLTSLLISAFFWALLVVTFIFVPVQTAVDEPVYREIRIQLAPMEEKQPAPELLPEPELPPEPALIEAVPAETPELPTAVSEIAAAQSEPAPAPAAPAPQPVKAEPAPAPVAKTPEPTPEPVKQTLVKSVDQLMAEQAASRGTKKSAADDDWDALFGDSSTATSAVSTGEKTFVTQEGPSMKGSAASASVSDTGTAAAADSGKAVDASVSEGTASALSSVADAAGAGIVTAGTVSGSGGSGRLEGGATGGSASESGSLFGEGMAGRRLVRPATTEIVFTAEQKALITASIRDIRISFKVRADGTVLRDSILIEKKASLPAQISQEIERQISEWFFETGTSDGQAVFLYSIIKE
ncbi:MAG: hypothetical protein KBT02_08520 [Treponema sp.]|nr:hypothetical protein [Candidatus Treponema caballi]